ncbi:MAG: PaaI family thioesterase [Actinobacteria bacterium]|nr:PaaI family thioesterase [Actinomycetota bacterium]
MSEQTRDRQLSGSIELGRGCYGCGPDNPGGLGLDFIQRGDVIEARFAFDETYAGAPTYVHGGVIMTALDDAMAWAAIAIHAKFSVTLQFESRFLRPVKTGQPHLVEATTNPIDPDGKTMQMSSLVLRADGTVCAEASGTYRAIADL